jgi:hypothetical protein
MMSAAAHDDYGNLFTSEALRLQHLKSTVVTTPYSSKLLRFD